MKKYFLGQKGVTMIELILVVGILATLLGMSSIALFRTRTVTANDSTSSLLISDLQSQQVKAMSGDAEGRSDNDDYGIKLENDEYTLFHGQVFNPSDTSNFTVSIEGGTTLASTFTDDTIIFSAQSGEIQNFVAGQNTITIVNTSTGQNRVIELNKYGVVIGNN